MKLLCHCGSSQPWRHHKTGECSRIRTYSCIKQTGLQPATALQLDRTLIKFLELETGFEPAWGLLPTAYKAVAVSRLATPA